MNYVPGLGEPDKQIQIKEELTYEGLDFLQFYIFVKDADSAVKNNKEEIFRIY